MSVLLTGAAGRIGSTLRESLPALGWDVRGFDREPTPGGITGSLDDAEALDVALAGVSAIVHLAGIPSEAPWPQLRDANVDGLVALLEAARRHDVRRVVLASSNHATGFTPNGSGLPADVAPRPDTMYGVTKAFAESLARYYVDRYGFEVACLRIGTFAESPTNTRALATWLSPGDCTRLVDACLRSPDLDYAIVWGVSANTRNTWSHAAGRALGYEARDDAEAYVADLRDPAPKPSDALVGGEFTGPQYGIGEP